MKLLVRCESKTVFEINRETLNPLSTGCYDAYCFSDPLPNVEYISHSEWVRLRNEQWDREMKSKLGYSRIGLRNV